MKNNKLIIKLAFILFTCGAFNENNNAQTPSHPVFTHADTLRGTNGPYRKLWNVLKYEITVKPDFAAKTLLGNNRMTYFDNGVTLMQIDLQEPMQIDSAVGEDKSYRFTRDGNVYWVEIRDTAARYKIRPCTRVVTFYFHGKPREAVKPPWDGGWIWTKDAEGNPWMTVACQGLGASVWYPCKDIQSDKPDSGAIQHIIVPDSLVAVGNGRMTERKLLNNGNVIYSWEVKAAINNYCIVPYIGKYFHFSDVYKGENGRLDMDYWVMPYNVEKAKKQFTDAPRMMKALEYWFGPFPFYEDGYKIVEAPFLGMEHQSAIGYGNKFMNGYNTSSREKVSWSDTKWEQMFDYIIIHESGHEWFGNNITSNDLADTWIHESFACYSEVLFVETWFGKKAAADYVAGTRKNILNEQPIISPYGVNADGDLDVYFKGSNIIHMIRQIFNDDKKFNAMLRGLNKTFYHQSVSSQQIETYISTGSNKDLSKIFDQYLRTTMIPVLEYKTGNNTISFKWDSTVAGFNLPVKVSFGKACKDQWIEPTPDWQSMKAPKRYDNHSFLPNENWLIRTKRIDY